MVSNHQVLYTILREKGVGEVVCCISKKVPTPMAIAKTINKTAVVLVEKRTEKIFLIMKKKDESECRQNY